MPDKPPFTDTATLGEDPLEMMRKNADAPGGPRLGIDDVTAAVRSLAFRKVGPTEIDDYAEMDEQTLQLPKGFPEFIVEDGKKIPITYRRQRPVDLQSDPLIEIGLQPVMKGDPRFKDYHGVFSPNGWIPCDDSIWCFISTERLNKWKDWKRSQHLGKMIKGLEYQEHRILGDVPGVAGTFNATLEITEKAK